MYGHWPLQPGRWQIACCNERGQSDAVAIVVSEETGSISIAHSGRIIRRLDSERLENVLLAFYRPEGSSAIWRSFLKWLGVSPSDRRKER